MMLLKTYSIILAGLYGPVAFTSTHDVYARQLLSFLQNTHHGKRGATFGHR